ncbi:MAG: chemotaxis protein CheC [Firmicutes bacterium]|nr:chemotaxis protein CheC [Bacillota bacterium]
MKPQQPTTADLLREVGSIGAGHAATALSVLTGSTVRMRVPRAENVPFAALADVLGGPECVIACVYVQLAGDLSGSLFVAQPLASARRLLAVLLPGEPTHGELSELQKSGLEELANILAGAYLTALMDFTELSVTRSVPVVAVDMAQALLSVGVLLQERPGSDALVVSASIEQPARQHDAHLIMLPDPDAAIVLRDALLRRAGV